MNRTIDGNDALTGAVVSIKPKLERDNLFMFITAKITSEQKTSINTNNPRRDKAGNATLIFPKNNEDAMKS